MRVCVLLSEYPEDSSPLAGLDPMFDPTPWLRGHEVDVVVLRKGDARPRVRALAATGYDVFLNLCDGTWYEDVAGLEVVEELERIGVPFTGPSSRLYALTKQEMKQAVARLGVRTPAWVFARTEADVATACRELRFPVIVKHFDGCASVGMTRASRVTAPEALPAVARAMIEMAGGALVEEFIEGSEYTVLVAEDPDHPEAPRCFLPVGCVFPPGETFKHFELKWVDYEALRWEPCADPALTARLQEATRRVFAGLGGVSYSRCDFRVDDAGDVWFLEINTNCGIFYPAGLEGCADMILKWDAIGHRGFMDHILACARRGRGRGEALPSTSRELAP